MMNDARHGLESSGNGQKQLRVLVGLWLVYQNLVALIGQQLYGQHRFSNHWQNSFARNLHLGELRQYQYDSIFL
jgi:hypothetical protein